jgi:GNAT superfamily N-acetyltransferase
LIRNKWLAFEEYMMEDEENPDISGPDDVETVNAGDVDLVEAMMGYDILVQGQDAGAIEGVPGNLEYLMVHPHWEDNGVARAALKKFIDLSRDNSESKVNTNNTVHPAMKHILETEGFVEQTNDIGWEKEI